MQRSAREDLILIRQFMEEGRREVADRGVHLLIWGVVVAAGLTATYVRVGFGAGPDPRWVWLGLMALGWIGSVLMGRREGRRERVRTLGRRVLRTTWMGVGVSLTLVGIAGMFGGLLNEQALPGLMSIIIAAPILTTAVLTGHRWLGVAAAAWWGGGAVMLVAPGVYTLLLMAGMSLVLMALPGAALYVRSRGGVGSSEALSEAE